MEESWLCAVGFSGKYSVSSLGRIRSEPRLSVSGRRIPGGVLRPSLTTKYQTVVLYGETGARTYHVHAVVAEAFIGPRQSGMHVDHINQEKHDNRACNLRYVTRFENFMNVSSRRVYKTRSGKFKVKFRCRGREVSLPVFATKSAAVEGRNAAEIIHFGAMAPRR